MEAQRAEWLSAHLNLLQQDRACLDQGQQGVQQLQLQAQQLGNSLRADRDALRTKRQVSHSLLSIVLTGVDFQIVLGVISA